MPAGQFRHRVTFQAETETPDSGGGYSLAWSDVTTVWGGFKPERGSERVKAGRLEATLGGVLTVRSSTVTRTITEAHRVLINGDAYNIHAIANPDGRNKYLELSVVKGVAT